MIIAMKAYKIETRAHEIGSWSIYAGETRGRATYRCILALKAVYSKVDFTWINSCRRAPEYDDLCNRVLAPLGCVAWKHGNQRWEWGKDEWYEGDRFPKENIEQI
jgi:hypothetical protein